MVARERWAKKWIWSRVDFEGTMFSLGTTVPNRASSGVEVQRWAQCRVSGAEGGRSGHDVDLRTWALTLTEGMSNWRAPSRQPTVGPGSFALSSTLPCSLRRGSTAVLKQFQ